MRGVAKRDQLAPTRQVDWIEKRLIPRQADYNRNSAKYIAYSQPKMPWMIAQSIEWLAV